MAVSEGADDIVAVDNRRYVIASWIAMSTVLLLWVVAAQLRVGVAIVVLAEL